MSEVDEKLRTLVIQGRKSYLQGKSASLFAAARTFLFYRECVATEAHPDHRAWFEEQLSKARAAKIEENQTLDLNRSKGKALIAADGAHGSKEPTVGRGREDSEGELTGDDLSRVTGGAVLTADETFDGENLPVETEREKLEHLGRLSDGDFDELKNDEIKIASAKTEKKNRANGHLAAVKFVFDLYSRADASTASRYGMVVGWIDRHFPITPSEVGPIVAMLRKVRFEKALAEQRAYNKNAAGAHPTNTENENDNHEPRDDSGGTTEGDQSPSARQLTLKLVWPEGLGRLRDGPIELHGRLKGDTLTIVAQASIAEGRLAAVERSFDRYAQQRAESTTIVPDEPDDDEADSPGEENIDGTDGILSDEAGDAPNPPVELGTEDDKVV